MATIPCPKCGASNQTVDRVCVACGTLLFNPSTTTVHMRINPALLRLRHAHKQDSSVKVPEHTIHLQIRGLSERLSFEDGTEVILGRTDLAASPMQRLDLSPYGAHDRGVSREHALLRYSEHILTITDLNSANGTTLNLNKLQPNQPHALKSGDEFMLGSLSIVVHFEAELDLKTPAVQRFDETLPMSQTMAFEVAHKAGAVAMVGSAPVSGEVKSAELK